MGNLPKSKVTTTEDNADERYQLVPSCRLTLGILSFFGVIVMALMRVNFTLSLVCMVKSRSKESALNYTAQFNDTPWLYNESTTSGMPTKKSYEGEFAWDRRLQGYALSSYFYGYILTQVMGGWLTTRFGGKHVLGAGLSVSAAATFITPSVARFNVYLLIFTRAVLGFGSGVTFPTIHGMWGVWSPPLETSMMTALTFLDPLWYPFCSFLEGLNGGAIIAILVSSQFCDIPVDNGWPMAFYTSGLACLVFLVLWYVLVYSSPDQHPWISEKERNYIITSKQMKILNDKIQHYPFPWSKALRSPPFWAIVCQQTAAAYVYYISITALPLFMKDVLRFNIKENGLYLILPNLLVIVSSPPISISADFFRRKKILSTIAVRKIYNTSSCVLTITFLIVLTFTDHSTRYIAVGLTVAYGFILSIGRSGGSVNPQDIAPRFAGVVFGFANTFGTVSGIVAPLTVGLLTANGTQREWSNVFYIAAGMMAFGGLAFLIFAKGEPMEWSKPPTTFEDVIIVDGIKTGQSQNKSKYTQTIL